MLNRRVEQPAQLRFQLTTVRRDVICNKRIPPIAANDLELERVPRTARSPIDIRVGIRKLGNDGQTRWPFPTRPPLAPQHELRSGRMRRSRNDWRSYRHTRLESRKTGQSSCLIMGSGRRLSRAWLQATSDRWGAPRSLIDFKTPRGTVQYGALKCSSPATGVALPGVYDASRMQSILDPGSPG